MPVTLGDSHLPNLHHLPDPTPRRCEKKVRAWRGTCLKRRGRGLQGYHAHKTPPPAGPYRSPVPRLGTYGHPIKVSAGINISGRSLFARKRPPGTQQLVSLMYINFGTKNYLCVSHGPSLHHFPVSTPRRCKKKSSLARGYRGTSLIRKCLLLGPYGRSIPRAL